MIAQVLFQILFYGWIVTMVAGTAAGIAGAWYAKRHGLGPWDPNGPHGQDSDLNERLKKLKKWR